MLDYIYSIPIILILNILYFINNNRKVNYTIKDNNNMKNEIILLKKEKDKLNNEIIDIINLNLKLEYEAIYFKKYIEDNEKKNTFIPFIEEEFGNGIIRVYENNIYYHGVCEEETQKWNNNNKCSRQIYEYKIKNNRQNIDKYNTFNIDNFCNNCLLIKDKAKYKIFECQGHQY